MATILADCDPAQPYGAAIACPRRDEDDRLPLALAAGRRWCWLMAWRLLYVERSGRGIVTFPPRVRPRAAARQTVLLGYLPAMGRKGSLSGGSTGACRRVAARRPTARCGSQALPRTNLPACAV